MSDVKTFLRTHPDWQKSIDLVVRPPSAAELSEEYPDAVGGEADSDRQTSYGVTRRAVYMHLRILSNPIIDNRIQGLYIQTAGGNVRGDQY